MARILVVDDEPKMTSLICGALEDEGHDVTTTTRPTEALGLLEKHAFDIVITDLSMPEVSGMEILDKALQKDGTEVVIMTAYGSVDTAVSAMKKGAADYLTKPFPLDELSMLVGKLVEKQKLRSLSDHYAEVLREENATQFIGSSTASDEIRRLIEKVAGTDATVLLTGKSGTGKELAARMLHELSPRRKAPFIAINCAAITETLLESELFGHEKGAQSKLLRVLEERRIVRVGGVDSISIDVRVVAATNRNLKEAVKQGAFREDLYFRLNVFPIEMPPLAERGDDVIELAEYFLARQKFAYSKLDEPVREILRRYDWPGNIRELRNVLERAVILSGGEPLTVEDFSLEIDDAPIVDSEHGGAKTGAGLAATEKEMILAAIEKSGGNKTEAARMLRISRRRLYSRMKVHGIKP